MLLHLSCAKCIGKVAKPKIATRLLLAHSNMPWSSKCVGGALDRAAET
jgi:hypothetical protein